ncbi:sensor histidine kinase [Pseudomonas panipatensis]|uniref:Histidine kinase n=1 Tax=Pseudomonas panipatensis TaxID=428992 RepID=A0A1G8E0F7_9PSED|nr:ATP-binding protein [Pseudomonas panipatensis]SDH63466.1 Histidine kinase [Pseudomonas panipatensis]SMP38927.1 Histidine kinase [Pseudomonas panipatensis]
MAKDSKVQSIAETIVADSPETLVESDDQTKVQPKDKSLFNFARNKVRGWSRSTQFVIAATFILGLTMFFVGDLVSERVKSAALQSAAEAGALYMEAFLEPYVQEMNERSEISQESIAALDQMLNTSSLKRHVESMKIWRPDGTVVYSTDKSILRQTFATDEIAGALGGHVVTDLEDLSQDENRFERALNVPLYEIYAPLRDGKSGKIVAVGEFYERADGLEKEIAKVRGQVWRVVGTATLAMLLLLFFIVRRGDAIIQQQQVALRSRVIEQARLHSKNAMLQRRIAKANQEFWKINELTLRRLGADLHDGPAQLLTLILIRLDDLADQLEACAKLPGDREIYESIRGAAQDALREVRDISRGLALPEISELSLREELALVAGRHEQRTGSKVELALGELPGDLPLPLKICIYRFVQESLNNAFMHAGGAGQRIVADYRNRLLSLTVCDSGQGFEVAATPIETDGRGHLGLAGLRYRVESFGGSFTVESELGVGTRVRAQFRR